MRKSVLFGKKPSRTLYFNSTTDSPVLQLYLGKIFGKQYFTKKYTFLQKQALNLIGRQPRKNSEKIWRGVGFPGSWKTYPSAFALFRNEHGGGRLHRSKFVKICMLPIAALDRRQILECTKCITQTYPGFCSGYIPPHYPGCSPEYHRAYPEYG